MEEVVGREGRRLVWKVRKSRGIQCCGVFHLALLMPAFVRIAMFKGRLKSPLPRELHRDKGGRCVAVRYDMTCIINSSYTIFNTKPNIT